MQRLRVAQVGAGTAGSLRIATAKRMPEVDLVVLSSLEGGHGRAVARENDITSFEPDLERMLGRDDVDAVVLSVPNVQHYALAMQALGRRKHVLSEYPLCQSVAEAEKLRMAAEQAGVVLHVGATMRYDAVHALARADLPRVGTPLMGCRPMTFSPSAGFYRFDSSSVYLRYDLTGGPFVAGHYHFVDTFRDLFGAVAWVDAGDSSVPAGAKRVRYNAGSALLGFRSGATAVLQMGLPFHGEPVDELLVMGTDGIIVYREGAYELRTQGGIESRPVPDTDPFFEDYTDFVAQVLHGAPARIAWEDNLESLRCSLALEQSAAEGRRVDLSGD